MVNFAFLNGQVEFHNVFCWIELLNKKDDCFSVGFFIDSFLMAVINNRICSLFHYRSNRDSEQRMAPRAAYVVIY